MSLSDATNYDTNGVADSMQRASVNVVGGGRDVGDEELRQWLESYIAGHPHLTTTVLAHPDQIGGSRTQLDSYLNGTYFLPKAQGGMGVNPANSKLEGNIRAYRERVEGTVRHGYHNSFLQTRSWQQFQHACNTAIRENVIVIVYAKPGVGKSRCLMEYSTARLKTMPITVLCSANITTRYFVQKIAQQAGVRDNIPTAKLEDLICEKLKKNPRPLFVDQANYLNEKALGTICYLWERVRLPIVLIGTHDLKELFTKSNLTEDVRVQLSSRIAMHYPLKELSVEEVKTIVTAVLGSRATPYVIAHIMKATNNNHRHLDMILPRVSAAIDKHADGTGKLISPADGKEVSVEELIDDAASRLMVG